MFASNSSSLSSTVVSLARSKFPVECVADVVGREHDVLQGRGLLGVEIRLRPLKQLRPDTLPPVVRGDVDAHLAHVLLVGRLTVDVADDAVLVLGDKQRQPLGRHVSSIAAYPCASNSSIASSSSRSP